MKINAKTISPPKLLAWITVSAATFLTAPAQAAPEFDGIWKFSHLNPSQNDNCAWSMLDSVLEIRNQCTEGSFAQKDVVINCNPQTKVIKFATYMMSTHIYGRIKLNADGSSGTGEGWSASGRCRIDYNISIKK